MLWDYRSDGDFKIERDWKDGGVIPLQHPPPFCRWEMGFLRPGGVCFKIISAANYKSYCSAARPRKTNQPTKAISQQQQASNASNTTTNQG